MLFFVLADVEIFVQLHRYKPVAFQKPLDYCKEVCYALAVVNLLSTVLAILFSFLAFTAAKQITYAKVFYDCLIFKALFASPFLAMEFYDLIFENVYIDVKFQLNPLKPITNQRFAKKKTTFDADEDSGELPENSVRVVYPSEALFHPIVERQTPSMKENEIRFLFDDNGGVKNTGTGLISQKDLVEETDSDLSGGHKKNELDISEEESRI